jgi:glyoxylase-like metal-dependent hydrolase (beta-lactamase superfamily II)
MIAGKDLPHAGVPTSLSLVVPGVWRWQSGLAGLHHPVSSYIWQRTDGCILIDPAADLTGAILAQHGLGLVRAILITHVQEEHVAGCANFPGVPVHVPADDEYLCRGVEEYRKCITTWPDPWEWETRGNFQGHIAGAVNERPASLPLTLGESLKPSASLGMDCQILATPGHGKHAVTILASIAGRLLAFCGDLVYAGGTLWNWFDSEWDYGLQTGPRSLLKSAAALDQYRPALLCPAHGPVIDDPARALDTLQARLRAILEPPPVAFDESSVSVQSISSRAAGFRQLLPHLLQYNVDYGNCNVLLSDDGYALMVDDGLCYWKPLEERAAHHRRVIEQLKRSLGIKRIEIVIPTHYHGDHTENIPELVAMDQTRVVALDTVAEPIHYPQRFNLASNLPWYGTRYAHVAVDQVVPSGTKLKWREYELEIFQLAGQTYHHCGIDVRIDGRRVLFVGDSVSGASPACEPVLCYNDNEPQTRGPAFAVERMLERRPDLLVCGHAMAFANPMPLLQLKQRLWKRQLDHYCQLSARPSLREFFDPFLKG